MSKKIKISLCLASFLVLLGLIIFGGIMTVLKWDFKKLSTSKYETNTHEISENYTNVSIIGDTEDIKLVPSENEKTIVVCYEEKNLKHAVSVKDGTLTVEVDDTRKWYHYIGFNFGTPKVTLYIPQGEYGTLKIKSDTGDIEVPKEFVFESIDIVATTGDVKNHASAKGNVNIKTSTGKINVENIYAGSLDLTVSTGNITVSGVSCESEIKTAVSTGKIYMTDTKCKNLVSRGDTGDINLSNVIASEKFNINRDTGDIKLDKCDANEIFIITDTGDVSGTLLTEKVFITKSDTGRINVPNSISGGRCEITTDTGDIKIQYI